MKWYNIILVGIILVGIVLVQRKFFPEQVIITKHDTIINYKRDTIFKDKLVPYQIVVENTDTIIIPSDSSKLVAKYLELHKEYFSQYFFKDTSIVDSMGNIITSFKVTQNKVLDYKQQYSLQQKKIINTTTIANVKNSLYIGGLVGKENVSPIVIFNNKEKCNYFVSYNLVRSEINFGVAVNINKLKFR